VERGIDMKLRGISLNIYKNESGTVLIIAILTLLLLTLIGIFATNTTTLELLISGNYKASKAAFHEADGGTQVGIELLEQNIYSVGFDNSDMGDVHITDSNFYLNSSSGSPPTVAYFPRNSNGTVPPFTNLSIGGNSSLSTGNAIQLASGYEGKGKGSGSGGVYVVYDIVSEHYGIGNSQAKVKLRYRFIP